MKKLLTLLILTSFALLTQAQTVNITLTTTPCNLNGVLTATTTGFTPPLTFTWNSTGSPTVVHSGVMTLTDDLTGYSGAYTTVQVSGGGQAYDYFSGAPPFTYSTGGTPAQCPTLGTLITTVTGGLAPYTFQYIDKLTQLVVANTNPANLPAGFYEVLITDANGCVFGSPYTNDSIEVGQINTFTINSTQVPANCTNGSITITSVTGGTAPYTYLWSNAATTPAINSLIMGYYYVAVTDNANCTETKSFYLPQAITVNANTTPTPATCLNNNGSITAFGSGGMPPYTYQWYNGATTQTVSNIPGGWYGLQITDANGCFGTGGGNVGVTSPIYVTGSATPSLCTSATGTATVSYTGGTAPHTVQWFTFPPQTGLTASNLAPGSYSFKVTDAVGCVRTGGIVVPPISQFTVNVTSTPATCLASNGSATSNITGGTPPFTYLWTTGDLTPGITNKPTGIYDLTVTDNMGCVKHGSKQIGQTTPMNIVLSTVNASCLFATDGSIAATALGGTAPYTWSGGINAYNNVGQGNYSFSVTDVNGCAAYNYGAVGYNAANTSCYCTITGTVYEDVNNNCIKEQGEAGLKNILVHCSGMGYSVTNNAGVYSFKVPTGSYTLSETVQGFYPLAACQNNAIAINATAAPGCVQTVNIANNIIPIHDMKMNTWTQTNAVPGFVHKQKIHFTNMGTVPETGVLAGYQADPQLNAATFVPSLTIVNAGGTWYNNAGSPMTINPGVTKQFIANYNTPANIPLGTIIACQDTAVHLAPIANWLTDYSPWDNVNYYVTNVVGPYDPNFKEVSPKGTGVNGGIYAKDSILDYAVHFQNLGSYFAQNVVVLDTLDADLDWTSLKAVYNSHPVAITISETGVASFEFKNINLPTKITDEDGSQGMISYTIKTKKNLAIGTQFTNSASIYFDFAAPVKTNTTVNTLLQPNGVAATATGSANLKLYPNPASGILNIDIESSEAGDGVMNIYDVSGKEVHTMKVNTVVGKKTVSLNTSAYPAGVYFISVKTGTGRYSGRFVKVD